MADLLVSNALHEAEALSAEILTDLDEENGGIGWWASYGMSTATSCDLSDYLIEVVNGIAKNLRIVEFYFREYEGKRKSADFKLRNRMRISGGDPLPRDAVAAAEDRKLDLQLDSYVYGFFNAGTSVLDTLAGALIGVAGLDLPIVRADLRMLGPFVAGNDYPLKKSPLSRSANERADAREIQFATARAFRSSLIQAGPSDWYLWLDRKRNQLSHRGGRMQMVAFKRRDRGPDQERYRIMERDPELTTTQGMRLDASSVEATHILEDELSLMVGLTSSLSATVVGSLVAARSTWLLRREFPEVLPQPAGQWRTPNPAIQFNGYEPRSDILDQATAVIVNPSDATRLSASHINEKSTQKPAP